MLSQLRGAKSVDFSSSLSQSSEGGGEKEDNNGKISMKSLDVDLHNPYLDTIWLEYESRSFFCLPLCIDADAGRCADWLRIRRRPVLENPMCEGSIRTVQRLITDSMSTQSQVSVSNVMPTRLIDVGGRYDVDDPRLIITEDPVTSQQKDQRYVALSYCWGPPQTSGLLKTTRESISSMLKGIPLALLPETLHHAIVLARRLGIPYIWIDMLCILQDDPTDWERESSRISTVYRNAFITICATQGKSCEEGFLRRHPTRPSATILFTPHLDPSIRGTFNIRYSDPWGSDIASSAWMSRGWTLQEILFSPRPLLFGKNNIFLYKDGYLHSDDGTKPRFEYFIGQYEKQRRQASLYGDWYFLVSQYSSRYLTFPADRLPAISAMAREKFMQLGIPASDYLAGLWKNDPYFGLLWGVVKSFSKGRHDFPEYISRITSISKYTAPSWSWACQERVVEWYANDPQHPNFVPRCSVESVDIKSDSIDSFGRVKGGSFCLTGKICPVPAAGRYYHEHEASWRRWRTVRFDDRYEVNLKPDWHEPGLFKYEDNSGRLLRELVAWPREGFWMILIGDDLLNNRSSNWTNHTNEGVYLFDLLLLETGEQNDYRRVGMFFSSVDEQGAWEFFNGIESRTITII